MILQKIRHSANDKGEDCIITHIVNEICNGGEYTVCSIAIPDACLDLDGWEPIPDGEFQGTIKDCDCKDCKKIVKYFKTLK